MDQFTLLRNGRTRVKYFPPITFSDIEMFLVCTISIFSKAKVKVCLCVYVFIVHDPKAKAIQPIPTEPFVELACDMTLPGIVTFLTYNLFLVSLCSILAFKTRKLPDNFNESKFISMCVSTTLVIWLAFIPTYFTTHKSSIRVLLLSLALLLNHTVALTFLLVPKIYAAAYVEVDTADSMSRPTVNLRDALAQSEPRVSNRVSPQAGTSSTST